MVELTNPLRFTGHPLFDVGVAGVCAYAKRERPEDVTLDDLDAVSDFMTETYYGGSMGTYLTCVFMNASFVQPNESADKRERFIRQYVRAHRATPDPQVAGLRCAFSGLPATSPLVRTHLPLFSGEDVMNFRPRGQTFVPAAGAYIVALFFLPFASRRAEGRLLAVHCDDPALTIAFAKRYLEDNRRLLALALPTERALVHPGYERELPMWDGQKKQYKYADVKAPRSLVVADLTEIAAQAAPSDRRPRPAALTAYHLSNSGQGPGLAIFEVPSPVVLFLRRAAGPTTAKAWRAIASRFQPLSGSPSEDEAAADKGGRRRKAKPAADAPAGRPGWTKNRAFEDLCEVFGAGFLDRAAAVRWLQFYVLGRMERGRGKRNYEKTEARNWALTELFLTEVMGMNKGRIELIRTFADKLADWIANKNDTKLFRAIAFEKLWELRQRLLRVQQESAKSALLFGLDEYAQVWLHSEDGARDESLVRDLVCIRVVERLHERGFFKTLDEGLVDPQPENENENDEQYARDAHSGEED